MREIRKIAGLFLLSIILISCSGPSDSTINDLKSKDQQNQNKSRATQVAEELGNTKTVAPTKKVNTPTPYNVPKKEWTIKTGTIQFIGAASDGTLYGLGPDIYAVISNTGEVLSTKSDNYRKCVRDNFSGGSGQPKILQWFSVKSNGTIYSYARTDGLGPCIFDPTKKGDYIIDEKSFFSPLARDSQLALYPPIPSKFESLQQISSFYLAGWGLNEYFSGGHEVFWLDGWRNRFDFYINKDGINGGFVSRDGAFISFPLPESFDTLLKGMVQFEVTPWNDVYLTFVKYDQLGNKLGNEFWRVFNDGVNSEKMNSIPGDFSYLPFTYVNENDRLFYFLKDLQGIVQLDKNFNLLNSYKVSNEIQSGSYDPDNFFIGNDLALYYFDFMGKTLTKFSIY